MSEHHTIGKTMRLCVSVRAGAAAIITAVTGPEHDPYFEGWSEELGRYVRWNHAAIQIVEPRPAGWGEGGKDE